MYSGLKRKILTACGLCAVFTPLHVHANPADPCSLLTKDEFAQGQPAYSDPIRSGEITCDYDTGVVYLYSGADSQSRWEAVLKSVGMDSLERPEVDGIGDSAYAIHLEAASEYRGAYTVLAFTQGNYLVAIWVAADRGQPAESVHDNAVTLARLAAGRLK